MNEKKCFLVQLINNGKRNDGEKWAKKNYFEIE